MKPKLETASTLQRHPIFWVIDCLVLVATTAVWGLWDGLLTAVVLTLGILEGEVIQRNDRR